MARHEREAKVYFAVDGEEGYYIGSTERPEERRRDHERYGKRIVEEFPSTHETRYDDEYELIEFAEGMGIPLTNTYRKHHGNFKGTRHNLTGRRSDFHTFSEIHVIIYSLYIRL